MNDHARKLVHANSINWILLPFQFYLIWFCEMKIGQNHDFKA